MKKNDDKKIRKHINSDKNDSDELDNLSHEPLDAIKGELQRLNSHNMVKAYNSLPRLLSLQFIKGVAFGLGTFTGATVIVSAVAYIASHIEVIPILGEWILLLLEEMEQTEADELIP